MATEPQTDTQTEVVQPYALELIQRAEIDQQVSTAKKYPRDLAKVKRRMLDFATLDEETAESCFYTLARDGKTIQGPSVRLAEIAVSCYGNLRAASRLIDNDGKTVTSQGVCHDLENNTLISVEVKRRITGKNGKTYSEDMQVVTGNAANSISFRNAAFKVIPGALVKPVYEAAKRIAVGDASTLSSKRTKIIARLNAMQVTTERILQKIGKSSVDNVGLDDLEILIGLGTAIKDGDTSVDEAFPAPGPTAESIQQPRRKSERAGAEAGDSLKEIKDLLAARTQEYDAKKDSREKPVPTETRSTSDIPIQKHDIPEREPAEIPWATIDEMNGAFRASRQTLQKLFGSSGVAEFERIWKQHAPIATIQHGANVYRILQGVLSALQQLRTDAPETPDSFDLA